jgi:hypothetical protein
MWTGPYWIVDPVANFILSYEHGLELDEVEEWLGDWVAKREG